MTEISWHLRQWRLSQSMSWLSEDNIRRDTCRILKVTVWFYLRLTCDVSCNLSVKNALQCGHHFCQVSRQVCLGFVTRLGTPFLAHRIRVAVLRCSGTVAHHGFSGCTGGIGPTKWWDGAQNSPTAGLRRLRRSMWMASVLSAFMFYMEQEQWLQNP